MHVSSLVKIHWQLLVTKMCGLALRIWTSFWRREDSDGMDMWNVPMVQSRQPLTYRLMNSVGLGGPRHGSSWQRGIAESGSSQLSTLMIDIPGDLVWDLPCVQQASYLEGGPLVWMLPLYLHVNQKSDYDMMMIWHLLSYHPETKIWACVRQITLSKFDKICPLAIPNNNINAHMRIVRNVCRILLCL